MYDSHTMLILQQIMHALFPIVLMLQQIISHHANIAKIMYDSHIVLIFQ